MADITAIGVLGDIVKIAHSSDDPANLKALQAQAASRIDQFKRDLAIARLQPGVAKRQTDSLRRKLDAARSGRPESSVQGIVFREALRRLTGEDE